MSQEHFVYLYRTPAGAPVYVGYGHHAERAISHRGASHNQEFKEWLNSHDFDLQVAGPYSSESEAKSVEAALISALSPKFNKAPGDGPGFSPLGVPPQLSSRVQQPALTLSEIGILTGGALLVYLAPGDLLPDGRRKFDVAQPSDEDAVRNIERNWDIEALLPTWTGDPTTAPRVLIGLHGKPKHRFVVGALEIDTQRLGEDQFMHKSPRWPRHRWQIPLVNRQQLDMCGIRGRRVDNIKFGQFSHQLHIWVDRHGTQLHPTTTR